MSSDVEQVRSAADRVNNSLMTYILSLTREGVTQESASNIQPPQNSSMSVIRETSNLDRRDSSISTKASKTSGREGGPERMVSGQKSPVEVRTPTPAPDDTSPSSSPVADLDYEAAVSALTLQFLNEHEATRVAALQWLIMLHRKAPRKVSITLCLLATLLIAEDSGHK
jgi:vacuole morphology and inheritance protein 14